MKKILIIHTAFIGDIILSTPLIKKIKVKYSEEGCNITYVTTPLGANILKNNPDLNEIIAYDKRKSHKSFKDFCLLGKKLHYRGFDITLILHRYLRSSLLGWITGSPIRVGFDIAGGKSFLTKKIRYDKTKHEVERLLSFINLDNFSDKSVALYPGKIEKEKIDQIWNHNKLDSQKIILIAPGSKWFTKRWPLKYFNQLLTKLTYNSNQKVIIIGGSDELNYDMYTNKNIINLIGKTTLLDVAEICKRSHVIITNDSAPLHIASAFEKIHIIAIFGATTKELGFFPWSENCEVVENSKLKCRPCGLHGGKECPEKHFNCMKEIKPGEIYDKIQQIIK